MKRDDDDDANETLLRVLNVVAFAFVLALALMIWGAVFRDDWPRRPAIELKDAQ